MALTEKGENLSERIYTLKNEKHISGSILNEKNVGKEKFHRAQDLSFLNYTAISTGYLILHKVMYMFQHYSEVGGGREFQEGADAHIPMADSC